MTLLTQRPSPQVIVYPDSDGQPRAENTVQLRWIFTIFGGLTALFRGRPNVFVAGDLLWYPVEGAPTIRTAPDVLVAFGRPPGDRGSYKQWEEDGVPLTVVFEILSPGNRLGEMINKFQFYEKYGVSEYYVYNPDEGELTGWLREGQELKEIAQMDGWVSPRLGIKFTLVAGELQLFHPDGRRFATFEEMTELRDQAERAQEQAERAREQAAGRAERLAAQLRALGIEPEA